MILLSQNKNFSLHRTTPCVKFALFRESSPILLPAVATSYMPKHHAKSLSKTVFL